MQAAQIEVNGHNFYDLRKLFDGIEHEVFQPQPERGRLEMELSFLNKFRERQESWAQFFRKKIRVALGKGHEFRKILLYIGAQIVGPLVSL